MRKTPIRLSSVCLILLLIFIAALSACGPAPDSQTPEVEAPAEATEQEEPETLVAEEPAAEPAPTDVPAEPAGVPQGGVLHLATVQEPDTLDPHKTAMTASAQIMALVGGSLLYVNHENEIVPYLAHSWEISEDGLVYTFKLREDIKFHNGLPLTAQDFVWTYERAIDPETASPVTGGMLTNVEKIEALDDYTLQFQLLQPKFTFLYDLATTEYMQPLSQAAVEELGDQFGRNPVGTGAFLLKEWKTSEVIVLERNPEFTWAPQGYHQSPPYIDAIEMRIIPDGDTIMAGLEAEEIDIADLQTQDIERIQESGYQIITGSYSGFGPGVLINTTLPALDDVLIRRALNHLVNREAIVTLILQNKGVVQYGPLSPAQIGYWEGVEEIGQHYDIAEAEALILEAGYAKNADGIFEKDGVPLSFTALTPNGFEDWVKVLEILQSEWAKIGIQIDIQLLEVGVMLEQVFAGDYQLCMVGVGSREADILYDLFHSSNMGGGLNLSMVNNPELDALLEDSRTATDPAVRQEILNEIQRIIVEEAYVIPLYAADYYTAINPRVHDMYITDGYSHYFEVYITD